MRLGRTRMHPVSCLAHRRWYALNCTYAHYAYMWVKYNHGHFKVYIYTFTRILDAYLGSDVTQKRWYRLQLYVEHHSHTWGKYHLDHFQMDICTFPCILDAHTRTQLIHWSTMLDMYSSAWCMIALNSTHTHYKYMRIKYEFPTSIWVSIW